MKSIASILTVGPHQYDYAVFQHSQAYKTLISVCLARVLAGKHRLIKNRFAVSQVNRMLRRLRFRGDTNSELRPAFSHHQEAHGKVDLKKHLKHLYQGKDRCYRQSTSKLELR